MWLQVPSRAVSPGDRWAPSTQPAAVMRRAGANGHALGSGMDRDALALDARRIFDAAVRAVQAPALLHQVDLGDLLGRPADTFDRVLVVGAGKASVPFAGALEACLGEVVPVEGAVAVPAGVPDTVPDGMPRPTRIRVLEGGHPVPTAAGTQAAADALALARSAGPDDLVVALISGGGSALWTLPPDGVSLDDLRATTHLLLASGVPIEGLNTVRKHLSPLSGGRLALAAAPATLLALVLSDVVGDDPAVIASGPTVPDPTSFADATAVLDAAGLTDHVPPSVRAYLSAGSAGAIPETPGPDHPAFWTVTTAVIGTNGTALSAAAAEAVRLGYAVEGVEAGVEGEARDLGRRVAEAMAGPATGGSVCRLWGGETTVTVTGGGRGGRNQEVALAAALALDTAEADVVVLSGGTDGIDGPTDAAGGCISPATTARIRDAGLDPAARLADNDAYPALAAADALVRTGPTHTNVADVVVGLRVGS